MRSSKKCAFPAGTRSSRSRTCAPRSSGLTQTIPVSKDQFADMARELNALGVPLETVKAILPALGKGAKAAGVDTSLYAAAAGELLTNYKVAAADLPALQDQLNEAMKFEDRAKKPGRLFARDQYAEQDGAAHEISGHGQCHAAAGTPGAADLVHR